MSQTILIAAVDPNIIYLLQRYAEESGFQSVRCGYEQDISSFAKQIRPVLIILQIEPPETIWQQSLQRLKADPATKNIPVVAYSYFDETNCTQVDGITGFLQKSILYSDFIMALEQAGLLVNRPGN